MKITGDFAESVLSKYNSVYHNYTNDYQSVHYNPRTGSLSKYTKEEGKLYKNDIISAKRMENFKKEAKTRRQYHGTLLEKSAIDNLENGDGELAGVEDVITANFGATPEYYMPIELEQWIISNYFNEAMESTDTPEEAYRYVRNNPFTDKQFRNIINSQFRDFITNPKERI